VSPKALRLGVREAGRWTDAANGLPNIPTLYSREARLRADPIDEDPQFTFRGDRDSLQDHSVPITHDYKMLAHLETECVADILRDHHLALHGSLHDRHGVLLEECWFYLQVTSITLSSCVYHGQAVGEARNAGGIA
jgi:hypothetical protein